MPTNRLSIRNVRAIPGTIPAEGATLSVQFEAKTTDASATANVEYRVAPGLPYEVRTGKTKTPTVTTSESTVSQTVQVKPKPPASASSIDLQVVASIPGDVTQTRPCTVWIKDPPGVQVRSFRLAHGLTQASFAKRLGISAAALRRIEAGHSPSASLEEFIAEEIANG